MADSLEMQVGELKGQLQAVIASISRLREEGHAREKRMIGALGAHERFVRERHTENDERLRKIETQLAIKHAVDELEIKDEEQKDRIKHAYGTSVLMAAAAILGGAAGWIGSLFHTGGKP